MILSENDWYCKGVAYSDWYKCQKCGDTNISPLTQFCPHCGVRIEWKESGDE